MAVALIIHTTGKQKNIKSMSTPAYPIIVTAQNVRQMPPALPPVPVNISQNDGDKNRSKPCQMMSCKCDF